MAILYTATATATGGREGHAKSSDGNLDVTLTIPKEMGGPGGAGTNPEQLFAAGYAACFESALRYIARSQKIEITQASVTAQVGIGPSETGPGFGLAVHLSISLPDLDPAVAQKLIEEAHQVCPYSNATRNNIPVELTLA